MSYYSSCLFYALDRWEAEGGGVVFVKSNHWFIPHVQHLSNEGVLTQFVPPETLNANWHSLFGFYGEVVTGDNNVRLPMTKSGILLGTFMEFILGGIWAIKRTLVNLTTPVP